MHGAKALAFPVRYGQDIQVRFVQDKSSSLLWIAKELGKKWFEAEIDLQTLEPINTSSEVKAQFLSSILKSARKIKAEFFKFEGGVNIETNTNFPINWGLGTSSTLINNIAKWADVDPFALHKLVSIGSGYDIACAGINNPILYQKLPEGKCTVETINFNKSFLNNLYFVYSGKKKITENHIAEIVSSSEAYRNEIQQINKIAQDVLEVNTLDGFISLIAEHEQVIGKVINQKPISEQEFSGFNGIIKSLGAWGGDFMLAASPGDSQYVQQYFEQFGLSVIIPFKNMVLQII